MIVICFHIDMRTIWEAMDVSSRGNLACKQVKIGGHGSIQLLFQLSMNPTFLTTCRGQRANDLLSITVGTQSISPFYWSIDSGAFDAVLKDTASVFGHLTNGLIWSRAGRSKRCQDCQVMSGLIRPLRCVLHRVPTHTHTVTITQSRYPGVCTDNSWRLADHPSRPLPP